MHAFTRLLALAALVGITAAGAAAQPATTPPLVELLYGNLGRSSGEWPMYIAAAQNYFRDEGLKVTIVPFAGPIDSLNAVATGAVNLSDDQTDTGIEAVAHSIDVRIIAPNFTTVPFRLVTLPTITQWSQLKGATVSLGSKIGSSVISYRRLLKLHGVDDNDFSIIVAGNSTLRMAALRSGNVQATMLVQPFDFLAQSQGMHIMADSDEVMHKDWVFSSILVSNAWGTANRATVVHFLRAYRKAIAYGYSHRDESVALLQTNLKIDKETAEKTYDLDFVKWKGFARDLRVDPAALTNIANALQGYGNITRIPSVNEMYDPSYAQAALR